MADNQNNLAQDQISIGGIESILYVSKNKTQYEFLGKKEEEKIFYYDGNSEEKKNQQFVVSTSKNITDTSEDDYQNNEYFIKWDKKQIKWEQIRSSLGAYEANARFTGPIVDYPTGIQTYNITGEENIEEHYTELAKNYKKPEWVSLHACVSDIGLRQLTWNTNEEYYNYNYTSDDKPLLFKYQNSSDQKFIYEIKFVDKDSKKIKIGYFRPDSNNFDISENLYEKNDFTSEDNKFSTKQLTTNKKPHIVSLKIVESTIYVGNYMPINTGPIELYYEVDTDGSTSNSGNGGINKLDLFTIKNDSDNCFNYNCQYQNCYYTNCQYVNCKFINNFYDKNIDFYSPSRTTNDPDVQEISTSLKEFETVFDFIEGEFEREYGSFETFLKEFGNVDNKTIELELEGGFGRKATLLINYEEKKIKISNKGYLYQVNDKLRFKDFRLRDLVYFNITELENDNTSTETSSYIQEFVSPGAGKSNTIKYALGTDESFVIKKLNITGSVGSNIIVRLNHIKNIFNDKPIQNILKEFYYFSRDDINENHDINILIESESNTIGNEFFIDIQKMVKTNDDKDKKDTLSFSLNGIKFTNTS